MDTIIVAVYVIVDDILKGLNHRDDVRAKMSDAEVITTATIAMLYFHGNFERSRIFMKELGYVPDMLSKSRFNRRLHQAKDWFLIIFAVLGEHAKEMNADTHYVIDSFPIPVCDNYRIPRAKIYRQDCFRGYIASKKRYYYGLKLHLMVNAQGQPVEFFLSPANMSDVKGLKLFSFDLPAHAQVYADRGYNDYKFEDLLQDVDIQFMPMRKANSKRPFPSWLQYLQHVYRKVIETTGSLLHQLLPRHIHAVTPAGFELKIVLFVLALSFQLIGK
jgi:IS5 family transposase